MKITKNTGKHQKKHYRYYIKHIPSDFEYSNDDDKFRRYYSLKFFRVYLDPSKTKYIDMIFAARTNNFDGGVIGEYTLENGLLCMNDLRDSYGLGI